MTHGERLTKRRRHRKHRIRTYDLVVLIVAGIVIAVAAGPGSPLSMMLVSLGFATAIVLLTRQRRSVRARRVSAATLDEFLRLDPTAFEYAVAEVMRASGFRDMRVIGGSGDLSIDIAGRDATGRTVLVQCKRYASDKRIGSPEVQKFLGMARYRDESARRILVTTAGFTGPALDVGQNGGVELIDGRTLVLLAIEGRGRAQPQRPRVNGSSSPSVP